MNINTIFIDMGNTLLHFHEGPTDEEKEKLGLVEMAKYLSKYSEQIVSEIELEEEFLIPWLSYIEPRRKNHLKEYPIEIFILPFLKKRAIKLNKEQIIEAIDCQNSFYRKYLVMEDGLVKTLSDLKKSGVELGVISNSCVYDEINIAHFNKMGLANLFDSFTFSYYIGERKPKSIIFNRALSRTNAKPETCLMVGDSLKSDIHGAQEVGMKGVWYNPQNTPNKSMIVPEFEIEKLSDLLSMIN